MAHIFKGSPQPTIGVEWELALVDPDTGDLVGRAAELIEKTPKPHDKVRFDLEFLDNTVEIVTGVCTNTAEAFEQLQASRAALDKAAREMGLRLWTSGSHPTTDFRTQDVSDKPHYKEIIERTQYWGRQMLIWGLHVHVGVKDEDRVWPIIGGLMTLMPVMLAYSASSPAWISEDTGYASNRSMLYQQLPTAGIPYGFDTWAEYESFMKDQETSGVVSHTGSMHFDIRPACEHGTIEVRVCDSPATLWEVAALTAFIHCAVVYFDSLIDAGEAVPKLPYWHNVENKWRAARYGDETLMITDGDTHEATVDVVLEDYLQRFAPIAKDLGCEDELAMMRTLAKVRPGYVRQREAFAQHNDWVEVVHHTVDELASGDVPPRL
ncbi:glutamate--cysteine ligase [Corynebacterium aquilae]|uniref:Putative glutamate--cysteine ligase 2 n=1 Tax=Corynebacterium aquilae DSM 44791 TaxID=1431546 RepID=A0A1L7CI67_9CORY|nr:glutamate--cysteine ligase [Corynebacterium aquilae]APT85518.1 carboxylate--amine ligase [Corynebacterium aquilae DSM 44791]